MLSSSSWIKTKSIKPLKITLRDAAIISAIAAVAAIVILYVFTKAGWSTSAAGDSSTNTAPNYTGTAASAFIASFIAQIFSEYSGLNGALAKESIEWSRGTGLSGYKSRRLAEISKTYYDLLSRDDVTEDQKQIIQTNRNKLVSLIENPAMTSFISRRLKKSPEEDVLAEAEHIFGPKYAESAKQVVHMTDAERGLAIPLAARMSPEQTEKILTQGLSAVRVTNAWMAGIGMVPKITDSKK